MLIYGSVEEYTILKLNFFYIDYNFIEIVLVIFKNLALKQFIEIIVLKIRILLCVYQQYINIEELIKFESSKVIEKNIFKIVRYYLNLYYK